MKKILVIEDNETNMYLIGFILRKNGYEVIEARTGEEGMELALKERPDLIIMDIRHGWSGSYPKDKRIEGRWKDSYYCSYFLCHDRGPREGLKGRL